MKKLISLLAAVSVVTACSLSSLAADFTVTYPDETTGTLTAAEAATLQNYELGEADATYTYEVADSSVQNTILAFDGNAISVGSIQYINQGTSDFTFALKNPSTDKVTVVMGGAGDPVIAGYIAPAADTGFTVSGTVDNVVSQSFIDDEMIPWVEEVFEGDDEAIASYVAAYTDAYSTRAKLFVKADWADEKGAAYLAAYLGEGDAPEADYSAVVDATSGEYAFDEVAEGEYVLVLERNGAFPCFKYVTVADEAVAVDSVTLFLGDFIVDDGYEIGFSDALEALEHLAAIGDDTFDPSYDIIADGEVGFSDALEVLENLSSIWDYAEDAIDETIE